MPTQSIVSDPSPSALFLVITIDTTVEGALHSVRSTLGDFPGLVRTVSFRHPESALHGVIGVSANLWPMLTSAPLPMHLHPFVELRGAHHAPSTPGDIVLHARAATPDLCWELARIVLARLGSAATVVDETQGFKYFDNRDLLGFVDGTENPEGQDALDAVHIGDEDPSYAGGSYLIVQKYTHDMAAWNLLSTEEQEKVIGRTKLDDVELDDQTKPDNSHVALNDVDGDILRLNMPFGSFREGTSGTYFAGYAADPRVTEEMLRNMFIGKPEGNTDRILDFSTASTGTLFFIPSIALLEEIEELPLP